MRLGSHFQTNTRVVTWQKRRTLALSKSWHQQIRTKNAFHNNLFSTRLLEYATYNDEKTAFLECAGTTMSLASFRTSSISTPRILFNCQVNSNKILYNTYMYLESVLLRALPLPIEPLLFCWLSLFTSKPKMWHPGVTKKWQTMAMCSSRWKNLKAAFTVVAGQLLHQPLSLQVLAEQRFCRKQYYQKHQSFIHAHPRHFGVIWSLLLWDVSPFLLSATLKRTLQMQKRDILRMDTSTTNTNNTLGIHTVLLIQVIFWHIPCTNGSVWIATGMIHSLSWILLH